MRKKTAKIKGKLTKERERAEGAEAAALVAHGQANVNLNQLQAELRRVASSIAPSIAPSILPTSTLPKA